MSTTAPEARARWAERRKGMFRAVFAPRPRLSIDEWADRYRFLDELSATGVQPWRTSFVPYLRDILRTLSSGRDHVVVIMKSSQIGYTQGVITNLVLYHVHQRPRPMLIIQPSDSDAREFSTDKLQPVIDATPVVRRLIRESVTRGPGAADKIQSKRFPGGSIRMVGAESPKGLRRTSVALVAFDEVDGYNVRGAGKEGDQIGLGKARTDTFFDWLVVLGSTPTKKTVSRIWKAFVASDQRHYNVPCPHCAGLQKLEWGDRETLYGLKFSYTKLAGGTRVVTPGSVYYLCRHCRLPIFEQDKARMVAAGKWIAENPDSPTPGFHLTALISPFPGAYWANLAQRYLDAVDDSEQMQVFWNTVLGLPWDDGVVMVESSALLSRRIAYAAEVPMEAGLLTCAVDTQGNRLEYMVTGWGAGEENWMIETNEIPFSPANPKAWRTLDEILNREWVHESGGRLRIERCLVDAGGHFNEEVSNYCAAREPRVRMIRGSAQANQPLVRKTYKPNKHGATLMFVGTDTAKDTLAERLALDGFGPMRLHWPLTVDEQFFKQLTSERRVIHYRGGRPVRKWELPKGYRNEALDLTVYNFAALRSLGLPTSKRLREFVAAVKADGRRRAEEDARLAAAEAAGAPAVPARPPGRAGTAGRAKRGRRRLRVQD